MNDELSRLIDDAVEGRLSDAGRERLERLVLESPDARRLYVELLHQHASLQSFVSDTAVVRPAPRRRRAWPWAAVAALVLVGVGVAFWPSSVVATLAEAKGCTWGAGTLPTEPGAALGVGRLRLSEGVARIVFASGADVTVEGPADVELTSAMGCVLRGGRLVAKVPPSAHGFAVETPTASLIDFGTEFGVNVRDGKTADVQVFSGRVDVTDRATGATRSMNDGQSLRFADGGPRPFEPEQADVPTGPALAPGLRAVQITTAIGRGKDAYVQPMPSPPADRRSDILLLVKNTVPKSADWYRKAYIGLDLAPLAGSRVADAELHLTFAPTGMGYASEVPDATFAVHGLTDESLDGWSESALRWADAPANHLGGADIDPAQAVKLGTFRIDQGQLAVTRSVGGPALAEFLNRDTNGIATLIVVRETAGSGRSDLVHGFASKRHPDLPPPTLKLTVTDVPSGKKAK